MTTNKPENDLLKQAQALREKANSVGKETSDAFKRTSVGQFHNNIGIIARAIEQATDTYEWSKEKIFRPAGRVLDPAFGWIWRGYKGLWDAFCYPTQPLHKDLARWTMAPVRAIGCKLGIMEKTMEAPDGKFSPSRAGALVLATAFAAASPLSCIPFAKLVIPEPISDASYSTLYEPLFDGARMGANALLHGGNIRTEQIFLNGVNKNKVLSDNEWVTGGCENTPACSPEDGVTFVIRPSLMHHAWSLASKGTPFLPDQVAKVIPSVTSDCTVTSYGSRWRVFKWMESYPTLLDVQCKPITTPATNQPPPLASGYIATPGAVVPAPALG